MGNKSWQELATKAKDIARRIVNGNEENKNGERLIHIVYRLDTFATNALNKKFAQSGSIGSVHTYAGGTQVISTRHADGSEGSFNTDGECTPTDNPMDIEVDAYINGGNGGGGGQSSPAAAMVLPESKTNKNMKKNVIKLNENALRQIVAESVKKVLNEEYVSNEDSELYQVITTFLNEIHRIIKDAYRPVMRQYTDGARQEGVNDVLIYYGDEIKDVQQAAIRLRDALIYPKQRRMGVSQGDLTFDDLS